MKVKTVAITAAGALLLGACLISTPAILAQAPQDRVVHIAELEIEPDQLDAYKNALREEIEASIRIEPGVLTLYAVAVKGQPDQIRLFEIYASTEAYQAHLRSEHFKKYKTQTVRMVRSLKLIQTEPVLLAGK